MKKEEFFSLIATEFNADSDSINETTVLTEIPDWDSMSILVIMSMVDEHFGITLSADDFIKFDTVGDIVSKLGVENFS